MIATVAMLEIPPKPVAVEVGRPRYGGLFDLPDGGSLRYVLPGEVVEMDGAASHPVRVVRESKDHVIPGCVHFGTCGGCHYQQAAYPAQLGLKREILYGILQAAGLRFPPEIATHQGEPWGYRNRIRLRVEADPESTETSLRVGYSRPGSNEFLPIRMCPIAAPLLWRAAETLLRMGAADSLPRRWLRATSEVEIFCLPDESRLQLSFLLRDLDPTQRDPASFAAFCERVRAELPELVGAGAELDPDLGRRVRRAWKGATWGAAGLPYPAAGRRYWVGRGAFFQVNRFLVDRLVALVVAEGVAGGLAWDLFAGVGLCSRALVERFDRVIAVEGGEAAAADLTSAGRGGKGQPRFEAVRSSALEFLRARELQRERPDLIVLDPPRAGLGGEVSAILAQLAVPRMVYVSCDPVTLARDLAVLTRGAYRIDSVDLIDLFPQTYHMETIVHLSRA